jgi:hypothetical protein
MPERRAMSIAVVRETVRLAATNALHVALDRVDGLIRRGHDLLPIDTDKGKSRHDKQSWTTRCEGLLGGQTWKSAERMASLVWHERAEPCSRVLSGREFARDVHGLGFTFGPTWRRRCLGGVNQHAPVVLQGKSGQSIHKGRPDRAKEDQCQAQRDWWWHPPLSMHGSSQPTGLLSCRRPRSVSWSA